MKYDDASWHYAGDFPEDLPDSAGATHTGMFLAWAMLSGLASALHTDETPEELEDLRSRRCTPGEFFLKTCDGKFTDEDISAEGNAFTLHYFSFETGTYLDDYEELLLGEHPSMYHVPDTWETFDRLAPVLDKRFAEWKAS